MLVILLLLLLCSNQIHTGLIQFFNSSSTIGFNETESNPGLVIFNDNHTETNNQSSSPTVDKNQFAETVVDMLLDLLEKANLSRTVSLIHNETELTELVEQDDDKSTTTTTSSSTTLKLTEP